MWSQQNNTCQNVYLFSSITSRWYMVFALSFYIYIACKCFNCTDVLPLHKRANLHFPIPTHLHLWHGSQTCGNDKSEMVVMEGGFHRPIKCHILKYFQLTLRYDAVGAFTEIFIVNDEILLLPIAFPLYHILFFYLSIHFWLPCSLLCLPFTSLFSLKIYASSASINIPPFLTFQSLSFIGKKKLQAKEPLAVFFYSFNPVNS